MKEVTVAALLAVVFLVAMLPLGGLRFLTSEFPERWRRALGAGLLAAILAIAVFYPAATSGDREAIKPSQIWFPTLFAGHLILSTFLLLWWRFQRGQSLSRFLLLNDARPADLWIGLAAGLAGWAVTIGIMLTIAVFFVSIEPDASQPEIPELMIWLAGLPIPHKLLIVAVAMTVEEAFFRAFLQPRVGWLASSFLFALAHAGYGLPLMLIGVLVISLVLGGVLRATGRLAPCIIAHGVFDGIQLLVVIPIAVELAQQGGWVAT